MLLQHTFNFLICLQAYGELSKMEEVLQRAAGDKYEEMKIGHLGEQLAQMEKVGSSLHCAERGRE